MVNTKKFGRPIKLSQKTIDLIAQAIQGGNYYDAACAYASVDYTTFRKWMAKAKSLVDACAPQTPENRLFLILYQAVKKAEGMCEVRLVTQWQRQMADDWRAIVTFLERRFPDKWGRQQPGKKTEPEKEKTVHVVFRDVRQPVPAEDTGRCNG